MSFTPNPNADFNGASLVDYIDGMTIFEIQQKFPVGVCQGYYDPEAGYNQDEVLFTRNKDGVPFYVYDRYGQVRFGCTIDLSKEEIQEFKNYLSA